MKVRRATIDDIGFVIEHLDERHVREIAAFPMFSKKLVDWWLAAGADVLILDGKPACVLGYDGDYTWFLATPAYYAGGLPVLRHAKRYWAEQAEKRGVILTLASSAHPDTERWFKLLGFEVLEKSAHSTLFRLLSTKAKSFAKVA